MVESVCGGGSWRGIDEVSFLSLFFRFLREGDSWFLGGGSRVDRRSSDGGRPNVQELQSACLVLNTAEYCQETTSQVRVISLNSFIDPYF